MCVCSAKHDGSLGSMRCEDWSESMNNVYRQAVRLTLLFWCDGKWGVNQHAKDLCVGSQQVCVCTSTVWLRAATGASLFHEPSEGAVEMDILPTTYQTMQPPCSLLPLASCQDCPVQEQTLDPCPPVSHRQRRASLWQTSGRIDAGQAAFRRFLQHTYEGDQSFLGPLLGANLGFWT